jgi:hypothetical protein
MPDEVRERFRRFGRQGGKARAARMASADRQAVARRAAVTRWTRARFGGGSFAVLGLPGGEMIDRGLSDLAFRRETPESLLVSLAAPRLRREGVPVPLPVLSDPEVGLYRLLSERDGDLAHARYNAYRRQAVSFADACGLARIHRKRRAA